MNVIERAFKRILNISGVDDPKYKRTRIMYRRLKARHRLMTSIYPMACTLEPTTKCNSACVYCARSSMVKANELSIADIKDDVATKIIDALSEHCSYVKTIIFGGVGEPLLFGSIIWMVTELKSRLPQANISLITNGILLDQFMESIITSKVDILTISLNSFDAETYKRLNRVDKFEVVKSNAEEFLKLKGDRLPKTQLQLLDIDANQSQIENFKNFWKKRMNSNDILLIKQFENAGGRIDAEKFDSKQRLKKRHPCIQPWQNISITKEGDVYPCCIAQIGKDDLFIGNLLEGDLNKILDGERLNQIRALHLMDCYHEIKICQTCDLWRKTVNPFFYFSGQWR